MKHKDLHAWFSMIAGGESLVSHAGGVLLVETARRSGLSGQLRRLLGPWRRPLAVHDPGKIVTDLAIAVALGGDAACDIAVLRTQPGMFGPVASDPTVSRLIATLDADADAALAAISAVRAAGLLRARQSRFHQREWTRGRAARMLHWSDPHRPIGRYRDAAAIRRAPGAISRISDISLSPARRILTSFALPGGLFSWQCKNVGRLRLRL